MTDLLPAGLVTPGVGLMGLVEEGQGRVIKSPLQALSQVSACHLHCVLRDVSCHLLDFQRPWALLQSSTEAGKTPRFQLTPLKAEKGQETG